MEAAPADATLRLLDNLADLDSRAVSPRAVSPLAVVSPLAIAALRASSCAVGACTPSRRRRMSAFRRGPKNVEMSDPDAAESLAKLTACGDVWAREESFVVLEAALEAALGSCRPGGRRGDVHVSV